MYFLVLWSLTCRTFVTEPLQPPLHSRLSTTEAEEFILAPDLCILGKSISIPPASEPNNLEDVNSRGRQKAHVVTRGCPALPCTWAAACSTEARQMFRFRALLSPRASAQPPVLWALEPSFLPSNLLFATRVILKQTLCHCHPPSPQFCDHPSWSGLSLPVQIHLLLLLSHTKLFPIPQIHSRSICCIFAYANLPACNTFHSFLYLGNPSLPWGPPWMSLPPGF